MPLCIEQRDEMVVIYSTPILHLKQSNLFAHMFVPFEISFSAESNAYELDILIPSTLGQHYIGHKLSTRLMSNASTLWPFFSDPSTVGKQSNAFALLRLPTLELLCPPVLTA